MEKALKAERTTKAKKGSKVQVDLVCSKIVGASDRQTMLDHIGLDNYCKDVAFTLSEIGKYCRIFSLGVTDLC